MQASYDPEFNWVNFTRDITFSPTIVGTEPTTPVYSISSEDVVQETIRTFRMGTNKVTVFFTYTEAGAKKMLDFQEAHAGQKMRTQIGAHLSHEEHAMMRQDPVEYERWKAGWLKWRTSKFYGVTEAEGEAIVAGLKGEPTK
jgi:hypothetical protein